MARLGHAVKPSRLCYIACNIIVNRAQKISRMSAERYNAISDACSQPQALKTLVLCRNVSAYSVSSYEPTESTAQRNFSAAPLPEGLFSVEEDDEKPRYDEETHQRAPAMNSTDSSMSFLT